MKACNNSFFAGIPSTFVNEKNLASTRYPQHKIYVFLGLHEQDPHLLSQEQVVLCDTCKEKKKIHGVNLKLLNIYHEIEKHFKDKSTNHQKLAVQPYICSPCASEKPRPSIQQRKSILKFQIIQEKEIKIDIL